MQKTELALAVFAGGPHTENKLKRETLATDTVSVNSYFTSRPAHSSTVWIKSQQGQDETADFGTVGQDLSAASCS